MLDSILTFLFGSKRDRDVKQLLPVVEKINQKEILNEVSDSIQRIDI